MTNGKGNFSTRPNVELVLTMTTTKIRLPKIKPVLVRILKEQTLVDPGDYKLILFLSSNLKKHVPDWLNEISDSYDNFQIEYCEKDYGPITKIFPFVLNIERLYASEYIKYCVENGTFWVTTIDDDIMYDTKFVKSVMNIVTSSKNRPNPYNVKSAYAFSCVKWDPDTNRFTPSVKYTHLDSYTEQGAKSKLIVEGYMGAIYNLSCFYPFQDFVEYVNTTAGRNKDCFRSDDFVISYFLNHKNTFIEQVSSSDWNKTKFWNNRKRTLTDYGQSQDALHSDNRCFDRYKKVVEYMASRAMHGF